jgi:predicted ester cyclase
MNRDDMDRLIAAHLAAEQAAEQAGDTAGCGALHGKHAAQGFYDGLTSAIRTEEMIPIRSHYGDDFCVIEHEWTGTVPGTFLGVEGHGRRISFRLLHVWEFRDGLISRENVWFDDGATLRQLATPQAATVAER